MMTALLPVLLGSLPFLVFCDAFSSGFEIPKLLAVYMLAAGCWLFLVTRRALLLPAGSVWWFLLAYAAAITISGVLSPVSVNTLPALAAFCGLLAIYLFVLNADDRTRSLLLLTLLAVAVTEGLIALAQATKYDALLPGYLLHGKHPVIGTLGNEEFLATLLGVGFFIALHFYRLAATVRFRRHACLVAMATMLGGLVLTHNKGGLLFIALYFLWHWLPRVWLFTALAIIGTALLLWLFPESIQGRALLWLAAATGFYNHAAVGLGPGQFENGYLEAVHALFTGYPALAEIFAGNAAKVQDAHSLILNQAAELGVAGLLLSVLFVVHSLRVARQAGGALGAALLLLLFKSFYTIVLGVMTSALLLVILLAQATPRETLTVIRPSRPRAAGLLVLPLFAATWIAFGDLYYQRGLRALMAGEFDVAQGNFEIALRHHPQHGDTWLALAQLHFQRHEPVPMMAAMQQALTVKTEINVTKIGAHIYFYSGHYAEAEALYRFLHVIYPGHLTTMIRLALIADYRGDYTRARVLAQRVLDTGQSTEKWSDSRNRAAARQILQKPEKL